MTTTLFMNGRSQAVRIPKEMRLPSGEVEIERWGEGVLIRPAKPKRWPAGYFASIRIGDKGFARPEQGALPAAPEWGK
jgi:antitoxin VapB